MDKKVRIDKWLWAVRAFKTRSIASDACRSGKVKLNGQVVKPSRDVSVDDVIIVVKNPQFTRTLKIKEILTNRVSAKLVPQYVEELTLKEEYDKLKKYSELNWERRDRGIGRPTKRERRDIDRLKDF